jgi:hypothetical protein
MTIEFGYQGEWIVYEMNPQEPDCWESDGRFDYHYCEDYNKVCVYLVGDNMFSNTIHTQPIRIGFEQIQGSQAIGTSWHGAVVKASVRELTDILGEPSCATNDGADKTNFEWCMQTMDGDVFTVYDWKEYRVLDLDETIEWHIGGHSPGVTSVVADLIRKEVCHGDL